MSADTTDIFKRMLAGGVVRIDAPQWQHVWEIVSRTVKLSAGLNASTDTNQIRERLSEIIGTPVDKSTTVFVPFHTNFGRHIKIGKGVFINHACSFLDLGGITIEDKIQIAPKEKKTSENHPIDPSNRKSLDQKSEQNKRKAWIGAGAIILPGVT